MPVRSPRWSRPDAYGAGDVALLDLGPWRRGADHALGSGTNGIAVVATCIFFPAAIALYFSPLIVAAIRKKRNVVAIGC